MTFKMDPHTGQPVPDVESAESFEVASDSTFGGFGMRPRRLGAGGPVTMTWNPRYGRFEPTPVATPPPRGGHVKPPTPPDRSFIVKMNSAGFADLGQPDLDFIVARARLERNVSDATR